MRKRILAILLTLAMMVSMVPSAFAANETDNGMKVEWASTDTADVYKLVVSTSAMQGTMLCNLILSYDNTKIVPIDTKSKIPLTIAGDTDTTDYCFTVTAMDSRDKLFTLNIPAWRIHGERTAFNVGTYIADPKDVAKTSGYVSQFEFYFKLKSGVTTSQFSNTTFVVEKKYSTTEPKSFLADFFSGNDEGTSGAQIQQADKTSIMNACNGMGNADQFAVSLTYPGSDRHLLGSLLIDSIAGVSVPGTSVAPTVTALDTDGAPMATPTLTWSIEGTAPTGVSIDSATGVVTVGKSAKTGTVTIKATSGDKSATATITITRADAVATTVAIGGADAITVPTGEPAKTETYTATVTDQYGVEMSGQTVTWTIAPTASGAATTGVSITDGVVSVTNAADADRAGITYKVTATCNGKTGTKDVVIKRAAQIATTVTVSGGANEIIVPNDAASGTPATTAAFTATVVDQYGAAYTGTIDWTIAPVTAGITIGTDGVVSVTNAAKAAIKDATGANYTVTATLHGKDVTGNGQALTVKRAAAAATAVQVKRGETVLEGTDTIVIPVAGAKDNVYTYSAKLLDQYGAEMTGAIVWTASTPLPTGVTVDNTAGTITVTNAAAKGSLTLTATAGEKATTITITVKDIDVTWTPVAAKTEITYGDAKAKAFTNSFPIAGTAKAGDTTLDGTFSIVDDTAILAAGATQTITVQFTVTTAGAYKGTVISKDYTVKVNKKPITVTMDNQTKAYGADNPALTFTVPAGALVGTDTVDVLAITGACVATTTSPAGTPVDITGTSAATNYTVTVNKGVLTITPATITGFQTAAPAHTVLANATENTDPAALKAIANNGAALPANVTVKYGTNSTAELPIVWANSADTYNVKGGVYTYKGTVTPDGNFEAYATTLNAKMTVTPVKVTKIETVPGSLTLSKAEATAASDMAVLGFPAEVTLTYDNAVTAQTITPAWSKTIAEIKTLAGQVTDQADKTQKVTLLPTNIPQWATVTTLPETTVTITNKYVIPESEITFAITGVTYGETPTIAATVTADGEKYTGVTYIYTYNGSEIIPTDAGTYTILATVENANYKGTKSADLVITQKPLAESMIAVTGTYTYTGKPITPTYTVTDAKLLKTSDYKAAITDNTNAGTAKITITAEAKGNYSGTATATFTIGKASIAALTPTITGTAQVGTVLTAKLSDVADSELTWQWMRAGKDIVGATGKTYTLTAADSNQAITVKAVAATAGNYSDTSKASTAVTVAKMAISGAVSIAVTNGSGADAAKVDATDTLTATITAILPTEAQAGATYQWYRNGIAIETAKAVDYVVTVDDAAAVLKVVVTPATDFTGTAEASVEVGKTALTGTLALSGTEAVGKTLTADYSEKKPKLGTDYTITWMRNGTAIPGAGTMTYVITAADQGKSITAKVTAKGATYTGEILSDAKAIPAAKPAAPAVTASAGDKQVTFSWTAPADNGAPITGYVIIVDSGAAVNVGPDVLTYTATGLTNGTACTATVAAVNSEGEGATGTATATPAAPVTPPTPTPPPTPDDGGNTNNGGNGNGSGGNGGGEASTGNKTETVQNADGSTTTTVTNLTTGAVTQTTRNKDGSRSVVETKKNGTVTTTDILKNGVKSITVATPDGTTTATVDLPAGVESARIALPVEGASAGTVVVLIHADGTRELIRKSMITDGKLLFTLNADAKLEILDNAKSFPDTQHHWAKEAIAFATAHELFSGVTDKRFDPNRDMNRAMLATVLYRLEGTPKAGATSFADVPQDSYYAAAAAWAMENGILLGNAQGDLDPDSSITREAMVTMLYRYAKGSPAAEGLGAFHDAGAVSGFAQEAMSWGVANGIITGKAGGKLDPKGTATRGEVATMLQRFVGQLVK